MNIRQARKVFTRWTWTPYLTERKRARYKESTIQRSLNLIFRSYAVRQRGRR